MAGHIHDFSDEEQSRHLSALDRKSTRLNSSHGYISYAVFCLKKKKKKNFDVRGQARTIHQVESQVDHADTIRGFPFRRDLDSRYILTYRLETHPQVCSLLGPE